MMKLEVSESSQSSPVESGVGFGWGGSQLGQGRARMGKDELSHGVRVESGMIHGFWAQ